MPLRTLVALWNKGNSVLKRHLLYFISRTTPFQNPGNWPALRTVVNDRAAKAPVCSPAILSIDRFALNSGGKRVPTAANDLASHGAGKGCKLALAGKGYHLSPIHPAQRPAWPNRGVLSSFCSSAPPAAQSGSGLPHGTAPGYSRGRCFPCRKTGGFWDRPPQIL